MDASTLAMLTQLEHSWLGVWVRDGAWTWPILEMLHFGGLCVILGALAVLDLRLLGFLRVIPYGSAKGLMNVAILGFAVNLATGILFFAGDPVGYYPNPAFRLKMLFVLLAGLNLVLYLVKVQPESGRWGAGDSASGLGKAVGLVSLVLWCGVIAGGRMIPFWE